MSVLATRRRTSALAAADDAALFAAVAALSVEAVEETYDRHATALCSLALLTAEDPELARDAVARAFIALWRAPTSICLEEQSLRAALAGEVYTSCTQVRETRERTPGQCAKTYRDPQPPALADLALLPRSQRDLLALILFGEHNRRQAARRVGLNEATAARMIAGALRTMRQVEEKPHPSVTAATGGASALVSSMTLRRSMTHRRESIS
jgi:DNA-directed RNA polymerase specialized sigma24 family protein